LVLCRKPRRPGTAELWDDGVDAVSGPLTGNRGRFIAPAIPLSHSPNLVRGWAVMTSESHHQEENESLTRRNSLKKHKTRRSMSCFNDYHDQGHPDRGILSTVFQPFSLMYYILHSPIRAWVTRGVDRSTAAGSMIRCVNHIINPIKFPSPLEMKRPSALVKPG
jgi:hypothetical protein